jgi:hypothetical protein
MEPVVTDPAILPEADSSTPRRSGLRLLRWAVNLWLVFHIVAIIVAPASVAPSSRLAQSAWELFQPYLQVLYLNNGYHFFAPDPGESTLVAFVAERDDGTVFRGRIPDRRIQPRQLYHRHFMISEHLVVAPPELREAWHRSLAEHIRHKYDATRVSLTQQTHLLPTMEMVRQGARLNDPASYIEQPLGVFQWED